MPSSVTLASVLLVCLVGVGQATLEPKPVVSTKPSSKLRLAFLAETSWALDLLSRQDSDGPKFYRPLIQGRVIPSTNAANTKVYHQFTHGGSRLYRHEVITNPDARPAIVWDKTQTGALLIKSFFHLLLDNGLKLGELAFLAPKIIQTKPLLTALFATKTNLEAGLEEYIARQVREKKMCVPFSQPAILCETRRNALLDQWFYEDPNLLELEVASPTKTDAGITPTIGPIKGARGYFNPPISAPPLVQRKEGQMIAAFKSIEAPYVGGVTRDLLANVVLAMEEVQQGLKIALVPNKNQRESIMALLMAALVVTGRHSLVEMVLVAKSFGYFPTVHLPRFTATATATAAPNALPKTFRFFAEPVSTGYKQTIVQLARRIRQHGITSAINFKRLPQRLTYQDP